MLPYGDFLVRRLIRLYPLHLFCLLLYVVLYGLQQFMFYISGHKTDPFWYKPDALTSFLAQLFMAHAWLPSPPGWNIPSWSISAELGAYAVFPLLALTFRRKGGLANSACIGLVIGYYSYIADHGGSLDIINLTAPLRCLAGFMTGMVIHNYRFTLNRLSNSVLLSALQITTAAAIILLMSYKGNDVLFIPPFALLVFSTWTDNGAIANLLKARVCNFLGEISYSIYLIHVPLLMFLYPIHVFVGTRLHLDPMTISALWFVIPTPVILFAAWLSYCLIEVPARRWLTRRWNGRSAPFG